MSQHKEETSLATKFQVSKGFLNIKIELQAKDVD